MFRTYILGLHILKILKQYICRWGVFTIVLLLYLQFYVSSFYADRKQYPWSSKLEVIAFPALFLLMTEISCKRLMDAFLYSVKVVLSFQVKASRSWHLNIHSLSGSSLQPTAHRGFQGIWSWAVLLVHDRSLFLSLCVKPCCAAAIGTLLQPEQTHPAIHFGWGDRTKGTSQKPHFQKSHKKHQLWYLTQHNIDINMHDCHFLKYLLS